MRKKRKNYILFIFIYLAITKISYITLLPEHFVLFKFGNRLNIWGSSDLTMLLLRLISSKDCKPLKESGSINSIWFDSRLSFFKFLRLENVPFFSTLIRLLLRFNDSRFPNRLHVPKSMNSIFDERKFNIFKLVSVEKHSKSRFSMLPPRRFSFLRLGRFKPLKIFSIVVKLICENMIWRQTRLLLLFRVCINCDLSPLKWTLSKWRCLRLSRLLRSNRNEPLS